MLIRQKILTLCTIIVLLTAWLTPPALAAPQVNGQAAVLIDRRSGKILYTKNANNPMAPASTTKILTAIIAIEKSKPGDLVKAGVNSTGVEPSIIGLKEGEAITMENLLFSLLLKSANDAAIAIAEHVAGSVSGFADLMNQRARQLGATNSNFVNPNGLPAPNHYTTAHDLALIARHAMENPEFRQLVSTKVEVIPRSDPNAVKWLQNHNKLLWRYEGANGIKTGYTKEAKQCLVGSAVKGDQEFITVVLGAEGNNIWTDAQSLLDYGFTSFATVKLKDANVPVMTAKVKRGMADVTLVTEKDIYNTVPKGKTVKVSEKVEVKQNISAPVKKGQVLGKIRFLQAGTEVGAVNLVAQNEVAAKGLNVVKDKANPQNALVIGSIILVAFVAWNIRKRRRRSRKGRIWHRNVIR